jgi:sugar lactone lactonase YvrE
METAVSYVPALLLSGLVFPESPRWHRGRLWMVDMHDHRVLTLSPTGQARTIWHMRDDRPSALGVFPDGRVLVSSGRKRRLLWLDERGTELFADLSDIAGDNFNDMITDGQGRTYIGNRYSSQPPSPEGSRDGIILVKPDGQAELVASDVFSPNGICITADQSKLIIAQSRRHRLLQFDVGNDGSLSNRTVFADTARDPDDTNLQKDPSPDGICLDAEGGVWFGSPRTNEFLRMKPGGEVTDRIALPAGHRGTACVLGGDDRRTLFLLTAESTDENNSKASSYEGELTSTSRGHVYSVSVKIPGIGWP